MGLAAFVQPIASLLVTVVVLGENTFRKGKEMVTDVVYIADA